MDPISSDARRSLRLQQRESSLSISAESDAERDGLELKSNDPALSNGVGMLPMPIVSSLAPAAGRPFSRWREIAEDEPLRLPQVVRQRLQRLANSGWTGRTWTWLHGPTPPVALSITPFFWRVEAFFDKLFAKLRSPLIVFPYLFVWIIGLALLSKLDTFQAETSGGAPTFITGTASFWSGNAGCGLNGTACAPFSNSSLAFRCPANTASVQLLNNRAVGPLEVIFEPLIVGGGDPDSTYRADSFICQAAIHYGLFANEDGGCGVLNQIGSFTNFIAVERHGLSSVSFDTVFPSAYRFSPSAGTDCRDIRDYMLIYNVLAMFILSFVLRPPAIILFWAMVCAGFWHEALTLATSLDDIATACGTFLPVLFIGYALWRCSFRWTLSFFNVAVLERSFILFIGYWVSVLSDETWERLPLQRLLPGDISKQPGALATLIILILAIVILAFIQLWVIRRVGWLPYYLTAYAIGGICVGLLAAAPGLTIRVHHYILALVLLPLCGFPTRLSLLLQGLLLGLFLSGAAEFGLDSFLQTAGQLRGDAAQGTDLPSFANTTANFNNASSALSFAAIPSNISSLYDGFALIVDDVEQQQGPGLTYSLSGLNTSLPHYFRLAYTFSGSIGDFTRAATWFPSNGTWVDPAPGPS